MQLYKEYAEKVRGSRELLLELLGTFRDGALAIELLLHDEENLYGQSLLYDAIVEMANITDTVRKVYEDN